MIKSLSSIH